MSSNELVPSERLLYGCAVIICSLALKTELTKRENRVCRLCLDHAPQGQTPEEALDLGTLLLSMRKLQACVACPVTQEEDRGVCSLRTTPCLSLKG